MTTYLFRCKISSIDVLIKTKSPIIWALFTGQRHYWKQETHIHTLMGFQKDEISHSDIEKLVNESFEKTYGKDGFHILKIT